MGKRLLWMGYQVMVHGLAIVGLVFLSVLVAVNFHLTDVPGQTDKSSTIFTDQALVVEQTLVTTAASQSATKLESASTSLAASESGIITSLDQQIEQLRLQKNAQISQLCLLQSYTQLAPKNMQAVLQHYQQTGGGLLTNQMLFAIKTRLPQAAQIDELNKACQQDFANHPVTLPGLIALANQSTKPNVFVWINTPEWHNAKTSILKDTQKIQQAAAQAKISPRLMVACLMVEQLRLYFSQRELYQKYFEPLKILANAYHISLGVMSIKEQTGLEIEQHLRSPASDYYLGPEYEHLLVYQLGEDQAKTRYTRLSSDDHSWNYLYGALYLKQLMTAWKKAGYDLSHRPEIVATLFNVGFNQSNPNPHPQVGGSRVKIQDTEYSFGRLAFEFYYSGELQSEFPLTTQMSW